MKKKALNVARSLNGLGYFRDRETDWLLKRTLAYGSSACAELGECLAAARAVDERDAATWVRTFAALAARVEALGEESLAAGRTASARGCFLRAMNYWRTAEYACDPDDPAFRRHWERSVACMRRALPLLPGRAAAAAVPFGGMTLPGYVWRPAAGAAPGPTLVVAGGNDSSGEELLMAVGPAAVERGYNLLIIEHPGHRGAVHLDPRCVRRPDMEAPYKAILDFAGGLEGADGRLALAGFSLGGYVAPRVAAFDPRVAALVADSPIVDLAEVMRRGRPPRTKYPPARVFDAMVRRKLRGSPILLNFARYGAWTMGAPRDSFLDIARIDYSAYTLRGLYDRIACPTLALAGEGEGEVMLRQAREFHAGIAAREKRLHVFTLERDGSDDHCQLDNVSRGMQVIFDWLDGVLGR